MLVWRWMPLSSTTKLDVQLFLRGPENKRRTSAPRGLGTIPQVLTIATSLEHTIATVCKHTFRYGDGK